MAEAEQTGRTGGRRHRVDPRRGGDGLTGCPGRARRAARRARRPRGGSPASDYDRCSVKVHRRLLRSCEKWTSPQDLRYTSDHEWARLEDAKVRVGLTDFAQEALGDIVFVQLPSVGDAVCEGRRAR